MAAERRYRSALGDVPAYLESDAGQAAASLLECYEKHDAAGLKELQNSSKFRYLEPALVRKFREQRIATQQAPASSNNDNNGTDEKDGGSSVTGSSNTNNDIGNDDEEPDLT